MFFLKKNVENKLMERETPPPFMENSIKSFHFIIRNLALAFDAQITD